jgi:hypothetical protein
MLLLSCLTYAGEAPADRLGELFDAWSLGTEGLVDLAVSRPQIAWQLLDPASRDAVALILSFPAADIRKLREGQAVIRAPGEASDDEWMRVTTLADTLDVNPRRVREVHAHTVDNRLVRVDLVLRGETRGVSLAWPADLTPPSVAVDLRARGVEAEAPVPLLDGGFEDPWSAGLAWEQQRPPGTLILRDTARVKVGATSLHLESHTRAVPTLRQRLALSPGEHVTLSGFVSHEGPEPSITLGFSGTPDADDNEVELRAPDASGWRAAWLDLTVPPGATGAWLDVRLTGPGAANIDDLTLRVLGPEVPAITTWEVVRSGALVAHADPTRCHTAVGSVSCTAALAARLDAALQSGLGLLSVPTKGSVDIWIFSDVAHRSALVQRTAGGPRGFPDDYATGTCWAIEGAAFSAACPLRVMIERAWGPPANSVLGQGLPRALAGSGVDVAAAARASLADVPPLLELAHSRVAGPSREAAITSFAAWLLATQSIAAVRAAWQAEDLAGYTITGRDFGALEKDWRAMLSGR